MEQLAQPEPGAFLVVLELQEQPGLGQPERPAVLVRRALLALLAQLAQQEPERQELPARAELLAVQVPLGQQGLQVRERRGLRAQPARRDQLEE